MRKAGDEVEDEPGFLKVDTVAHRGPTVKGEFARSVNCTDMHTGWVFTHAICNNAHIHIQAAFDAFIDHVPFAVTGIDCDNGSEFTNHNLTAWTAQRDVSFTRSMPYKKNDHATNESKNGHLVRRYAFYWRCHTPTELALLNQLRPLVNNQLNYLHPTKKPIGWSTDAVGHRKRLYDKPASPYQRLLDARVLSPAQQADLAAYKATPKPTAIAVAIHEIQLKLTRLAGGKTRRPQNQISWKPPDPTSLNPEIVPSGVCLINNEDSVVVSGSLRSIPMAA